ncbi:hypothetical protein VPH35_112017 [Triticum aestivum]
MGAARDEAGLAVASFSRDRAALSSFLTQPPSPSSSRLPAMPPRRLLPRSLPLLPQSPPSLPRSRAAAAALPHLLPFLSHSHVRRGAVDPRRAGRAGAWGARRRAPRRR